MKLTLLERHQKTVESYLSGPVGNRFYQEEFLRGISAQRNEIFERQGKIFGALFLLTFLLIVIESAQGGLRIANIDVPSVETLRAPLSLLLSFAIFSAMFVTIDQIIIDRYIGLIGNKLNIFSFQIIVSNYTARNLWADLFTPKYFGLKSGRGHHVAFGLWGVVAFLTSAVLYAVPVAVVILTIIGVLTSSPTLIEIFVSSGSAVVLFTCLINVALLMVKFQFQSADFREEDGEPTPEFLATLEADLSKPKGTTGRG